MVVDDRTRAPACAHATTTRPTAARALAAGGLVGIVTCVVLLVTLHALTPGHEQLRELISEYVRGEHGSMFNLAVLALAAGSVALLTALVHGGVVRARSGAAVALALWSACMVVVVVFPVGDIWKRPLVTTAHIHSAAAILGFACLPVAAVLIGREWRDHPRWKRWAVWTSRLGVLSVLWLLPMVAALDPTAPPDTAAQLLPVGLTERVLAGHAVAVLVLLGCWAARVGTPSTPEVRGPRAPARAR